MHRKGTTAYLYIYCFDRKATAQSVFSRAGDWEVSPPTSSASFWFEVNNYFRIPLTDIKLLRQSYCIAHIAVCESKSSHTRNIAAQDFKYFCPRGLAFVLICWITKPYCWIQCNDSELPLCSLVYINPLASSCRGHWRRIWPAVSTEPDSHWLDLLLPTLCRYSMRWQYRSALGLQSLEHHRWWMICQYMEFQFEK